MLVDARRSEDADDSIVAYGRFGQACSSCQRNRVLQSAKPKEAVAQQELFGVHEPRSHREEACRVRDDLDGVVGERGRGLLTDIPSGLSHGGRGVEKQ